MNLPNPMGNQSKQAAKNRREWPRYSAERNFVLAAKVGGDLVPCTVVDISLGGAKLIFDSALASADSIELSHPDIEPVSCAQVWHSDKEIGVEFDFSEDSLGLISICIRNMIDLEPQSQALV
jgi:PilZ domain